MFNFFKSKSKLELLQEKYDKLMDQALSLEMSNSKGAEEKKIKAQQILMQIVQLGKG